MAATVFVPGCTNYEIVTALSSGQSVTDGITATASGTQSTAVLLTSTFNNVTVCATAADSVRLPLAVAGLWVAVRNGGAASAQVFGSGTDTINAAATATGVALANGVSALYFCTSSAPAGKWFAVKSA